METNEKWIQAIGYAQRGTGAEAYDVDYSYDTNEDRALRIAPVEQFSESLSRVSGGRYAGEVNFTEAGWEYVSPG